MKRRSPVAEAAQHEAESAGHVPYPALELLSPHPRQQLQQQQADDDGDDLQGLSCAELPSDAQAALSLLRHTLYPDPAAAAAAAVAARQTRHAKRSKSAPGPSRAAAAAAQAAAAAAAAAAGLPPLVLQHQLFTVLTDRTAADRDVEELRRRGCFRQLKLGFGPDEHVLCLTDDYVGIINSIIAKHQQLPPQPPQEQQQEQQQQEQEQQEAASGRRPPTNNTSSSGDEQAQAAAAISCLQAFRDRVVPACLDTHISRTQLLSLLHPATAGTTAASPAAGAAAPPAAAVVDVLRQLLSDELLVRDAHRPDCFAFTLPGAGRFASSVVAGRKELLQMLSRKKHSEALEKELMCVKLRGSCLTMAFHLRDLLGRGFITRTDTTAGPLVRLAQRKR